MFFLHSSLHIYKQVEGSFCNLTAWHGYTSFLDIQGFLHSSEQTKPHILYLQNQEITLILHSDVSNDRAACYMLSGASTLSKCNGHHPFHLTSDTKQKKCGTQPVKAKKKSS